MSAHLHIKRVTIRGFKTYRQETVITDISPHVNIVLGKNGSGKSNLLDAIQFVLSDKYTSLRAEERDKLLHEGAGRDTTHATVEVVFDNSSKQIPIEPPKGDKDNTEVVMSRTIGKKKDQLLVNGLPYTQQDFQTLLESMGMSRSNPYNIVEQGKISSLMKQSKAARLALFKEIAGTRVYDERKTESEKIMRDTDAKRHTIDTVIDVLQKRIEELEQESKEFKQFTELDTTRRSLEYSIYEREREIAQAKLEEIEKKRAGGNKHAEAEGAAYAEAHRAVVAAEEELDALKSSIAKAQATKRSLGPGHNDLIGRQTALKLSVKDLQERLSGAAGSKADAGEQLKKLQQQIKDTKSKIDDVSSNLSRLLGEEEKAETTFQRVDQRLQDVCAKRERAGKHRTKKDRDADLKKSIARGKKAREDSQRQADKLAKELAEAQEAAAKLDSDVAAKEKQIEKNRGSVEKLNEQLSKAAEKRDAAADTRKAAWKRQAELEGELAQLKETVDRAQRSMQMTMDRELHRGLESVRQIAQELGLAGVYGPLIELFTCSPEFHQSVEITGGNSLFGVVVDTDATAAQVIAELNKRKGGRVTFVPLNRISPARPEYPVTTEAMPMIRQLKYDPKFEKAFLQTFGKTLIARDLSVGANIAREYNLDTITLQGDRVDKKGALTGGHIDLAGRSRLGAQADIQATRERHDQLQKELAAVQAEIRKCDADMQRTVGDVTRLTDQKAQLREQITQLMTDITTAKREHKTYVDSAQRCESALPSVRASLAAFDQQLESLEAELASDYSSGLSAEEEAELKSLTLESDRLKSELVKLRSQRSDVAAKKSELDSLLSNNLQRKEDELNARLNAATQEEDKDVLARDEQELSALTTAVKELEARIKAADSEIDHSNTRIREIEKELEKLRAAETAAAHQLSDDAKTMDKLLNQRVVYATKREDCQKKIRELGALPQEAFDRFKHYDIKKLMAKLEKTNLDLKKMSGVNKKALDQYTSFTEEKEALVQRKQELDSGRQSIRELITHLDAKKDEAIERTFKTIAKNFTEVFKELVPGGNAALAIETAGLDDEDEHPEEEDEDDGEERKSSDRRGRSKKKARHAKEAPTVGSFTGINIKVAFAGVASANHQLSGGQESVVALSLIFAIQRCDPSPFYLLDEIDSALDPVHRAAVADMLKRQCVNTQFICTTFHPELLDAADDRKVAPADGGEPEPATGQYFGVVFKSKASFVSIINREQADELIRVAEKEAEQ